jgi:TPR repeat protein
MPPLRLKILVPALLLIALPLFAADPQTAGLETLRQAAEQGNADAQYELGILYEFGYNFADHKAAAYAWYVRAAEQGNAAAAKRRDTLKGQLSAAEVDRAQTLAAPAKAPAAAPTDTATR